MIRTPIKDPAEDVTVLFDFTGEMTGIVTVSVTAAVQFGVDPNVSTVLDGAATITGTKVYQRVKAGVDGVDYLLRCVATQGQDVVVRQGVMPVRSAS